MEHIPNDGLGGSGCFPSLVVETILRGRKELRGTFLSLEPIAD